ncbi:hypothetical protein MCEMIH15_00617 [Caulobacteraceae bacterium]
MIKEERDIQCKLKMQRHAVKTDHKARTCRYFGVGLASLHHWRAAYEQHGETGLIKCADADVADPLSLHRPHLAILSGWAP